MESLNEATIRLVQEIASTRHWLRYGHAARAGRMEENASMIIVLDFGVSGFTLAKSLPHANITRVEREHVDAVQEAVGKMLLSHKEV